MQDFNLYKADAAQQLHLPEQRARCVLGFNIRKYCITIARTCCAAPLKIYQIFTMPLLHQRLNRRRIVPQMIKYPE